MIQLTEEERRTLLIRGIAEGPEKQVELALQEALIHHGIWESGEWTVLHLSRMGTKFSSRPRLLKVVLWKMDEADHLYHNRPFNLIQKST